MPVFLLYACMLGLMFMRVYMPFGAQAPGKVMRVVRLNLMERTLLQRTNVYSLCFVLLLTLGTGVLPGEWQLPIVVLAVAALMLPVRYYVTPVGVGMNNVFFRPWDDFAGYRIERRRVVLVAHDGLRDVSVPLLGGHQRELTPVLGRFLHPVLEQERRSSRRHVAGAS
jgi:hypothetical protein